MDFPAEHLLATDGEQIYLIASHGDLFSVSHDGRLSTISGVNAKEIYSKIDLEIDILTEEGCVASTHPSMPKVDGEILSNFPESCPNSVGRTAYTGAKIGEIKGAVRIASRYPAYCLAVYPDGSGEAVGCEEWEDEVASWRDLKDLVEIGDGTYIFGLTKQGWVLCASTPEYSETSGVESWEHIARLYGGSVVIGLLEDGTVRSTRAMQVCNHGQDAVSSWSDIVSISVSDVHTVGLKNDGTVVACGLNQVGQCDVSSWKNIVAITTSRTCTVGIDRNGMIHVAGSGFEDADFAQCAPKLRSDARLFHTDG